jgi:hypothetical protein
MLETEAGLIYGMECKCHSFNCKKKLTFDEYRESAFVEKYFNYMTPFLKQKVIDIRKRWHSKKCFLKHKEKSELIEYDDLTKEEWGAQLGLFSLKSIKKGNLVAYFFSVEKNKRVENFFTNSSKPNCRLLGRCVIALEEIDPDTEITISYSKSEF